MKHGSRGLMSNIIEFSRMLGQSRSLKDSAKVHRNKIL